MARPASSRPGATLLVRTSALACALLALLVPGPAGASETPAPQDGAAWMTPTTVRPGERVVLETTGWRPGTQLQAVVCGDAAVGGSRACELTGAVTARAGADGAARHELTVRKPPRPCPCVVRVATFTAPAMAMNVPFTLVGHRVATPPVAEDVATSDLRVDDVELRGRGGIRALLGLGGTSTMVVTLANRGDVPVTAPAVRYGFGRGAVEPTSALQPDVTVPAGGSERVEVTIDVPLLAFGPHQGVAQWADGTGSVASGGLTVYPFGALFVLLAGLALVVVSDLQRLRARDRLAQEAGCARRTAPPSDDYPLPDVVFLEDVGAYVVRPSALGGRLTRRLTGRIGVDDLVALVHGGAVVRDDGAGVDEPMTARSLMQLRARPRLARTARPRVPRSRGGT